MRNKLPVPETLQPESGTISSCREQLDQKAREIFGKGMLSYSASRRAAFGIIGEDILDDMSREELRREFAPAAGQAARIKTTNVLDGGLGRRKERTMKTSYVANREPSVFHGVYAGKESLERALTSATPEEHLTAIDRALEGAAALQNQKTIEDTLATAHKALEAVHAYIHEVVRSECLVAASPEPYVDSLAQAG